MENSLSSELGSAIRHYRAEPVWLARKSPEAVLDPDQPIIDPHHHLWSRHGAVYDSVALLTDARSGHNVVASVFVECTQEYLTDGPIDERPLGETRFATSVAELFDAGAGPALCKGIVGYADLLKGDGIAAVLEQHLQIGGARFKGVRNSSAWDADPTLRMALRPEKHRTIRKGMLGDSGFRAGFAHLARLGLSFDAWLYHPQIDELAALADAFPTTTIVLDHTGGPLRVGNYSHDSAGAFADWKASMTRLSLRPNVFVKLGGLGMRHMAFSLGSEERGLPAPSTELAARWHPYIATTIDLFEPRRCMFESNFPVERAVMSYCTLWNAFKVAARAFSRDERERLFAGTAAEIYRLNID